MTQLQDALGFARYKLRKQTHYHMLRVSLDYVIQKLHSKGKQTEVRVLDV